MIEIRQLTNASIEEIHEAFTNAFSDYVEPLNLSLDQLKYMMERRGCDLNLSFGAFSDGHLVSFTLNGIGEWDGILTAYDTGTGTVKEFRKQGLAKRIFVESLPVLKEHKIKQYLLEVIKSNTRAFELYKKTGFQITRELDYFINTKDEIDDKELNHNYEIREIEKPNWGIFTSFWDFEPAWQNSIASIERKISYFNFIAAFKNDKIVGYGIIEKHTGDIPQIAVDKNYRKKGVATTLMKTLLENSNSKKVKFVNSESAYKDFRKFAEKINMHLGEGQFEMILKF